MYPESNSWSLPQIFVLHLWVFPIFVKSYSIFPVVEAKDFAPVTENLIAEQKSTSQSPEFYSNDLPSPPCFNTHYRYRHGEWMTCAATKAPTLSCLAHTEVPSGVFTNSPSWCSQMIHLIVFRIAARVCLFTGALVGYDDKWRLEGRV